jgi:hypothetical protein
MGQVFLFGFDFFGTVFYIRLPKRAMIEPRTGVVDVA